MINSEMWELQTTTSHARGTSKRSIFAYALAALIAAFLWVVLSPQVTHAADATWSESSIIYNSNTFSGPAGASTARALDDRLENVPVYTYIDPSGITDRKIHILFFTPGVDPGTADEVNYRTYDYNGPQQFANGSETSVVTIEPLQDASNPGTSSCQVDGGLGWIICPVTNTLASWMDWVFDVLAGFLEVRPIQTGQENALYRAWSYMRTIANIAFVIAFLVIIYSQLTNLGVNNYGIKKLLPRIIIAAILMNLSYIICSIAIDASNILGFGLQEIFINMRNTLVGTEGNSWDALSWESVASFVLSGGALSIGAGVAVVSTIGAYAGVAPAALAILLPALVILLVAVLVALLIMAARQAIITILTILSPLAFVAYLLPNTEKWFDKWRSIFMTMLVLFPAFSVIFGGSQLAGAVIIQNADSLNLILLGMIVQVAPLFVTPMLIKLSGSLLGRIAGMVNNPNKGIIDRTRNFAKDRAENMKARNLATPARRWQAGKRVAQRMDHGRRRREGWRGLNEARAENAWLSSNSYNALNQAKHDAETDKGIIEQQLDRDIKRKVRTSKLDLEKELKLRLVTDEVSLEKGKLDKIHEGLRAGTAPTGAGAFLTGLALRQEKVTRDLAVASIASQTAKRIQNDKLSDALLRNVDHIDGQLIQDFAAGVDPNGAKSAVAFASNQQYEADVKLVNERAQIIKKFQLDGRERQKLAKGEGPISKTILNSDGTVKYAFTFEKNDTYAQDAAIDMQLSGQGNAENILEIIAASGGSLVDFKKDISAAIPKNGIPNKAAFTAGVFIDRVLKGEIKSVADIHQSIVNDYIMGDKAKPEQLAQNDAHAINMMADAVAALKPHERTPALVAKFDELKKSINDILTVDRLKSQTSGASRAAFKDLMSKL